MKSLTSSPLCSLTFNNKSTTLSPKPQTNLSPLNFLSLSLKHPSSRPVFTSLKPFNDEPITKNLVFDSSEDNPGVESDLQTNLSMQIGTPNLQSIVPSPKLSLSDQALYLLTFIACTTSVAFTSLVIAAVPTLRAMGRAATSLSKLADTAREELPSTMAAIRLSGLEISDLTLELSDLSHEITDGVNKSTKAVQAAKAGIQQMGAIAREQTVSLIEERASLPIISLQPVVVGAAKKTSRAVSQATKNLLNMISQSSESDNDNAIDRLDIW